MNSEKLKWLVASLAVTAAAGIFFSAKPAKAEEYHQITVTPDQGEAAIQSAFNEANEKATAETPYKVTLSDGTYEIYSSLHIYSNTYLDAGNAVIKASDGLSDNLLKVGTGSWDDSSGYFYSNITVDGGKWDRCEESGTSIKVAHAKNFTIKNAELFNSKNGHLMETAAVDGMTVGNCYFHDSSSDGVSDGGECIQIDILVSDHFNGYENMDNERDYVSKNITVENCTFRNVTRAVGAHTGVYGIPYTNVKIQNNTLDDVKNVGLYLCNMKDLTISGNTINSDDNGIEIYNIKDTRNGSYLPANGDNSYANPETNGVIENNTINSSDGNGIYLKGIKFDSAGKGQKSGDVIPAGDYPIKNVEITGNEIKTKAKGKSPIILLDSEDISITKNKITGVNKKYYAIYIKDGSKKITVNNNTIKGPFEAGIRTFNYVSGYGKIQVNSINGNKITAKKGRNGISIGDAAVKSIKKNKITGTREYSIRIDSDSKAKSIKGNSVPKSKTKGIHIS